MLPDLVKRWTWDQVKVWIELTKLKCQNKKKIPFPTLDLFFLGVAPTIEVFQNLQEHSLPPRAPEQILTLLMHEGQAWKLLAPEG